MTGPLLAPANRAFGRLRNSPAAIGWAVLPLTFTPFVRADAAYGDGSHLVAAAMFTVWSIVFVLFDALVLRAFLEEPLGFRDRIPALAGWGGLSGLTLYAATAGGAAALGSLFPSDYSLLPLIAGIAVWSIVVLHVSPPIVADGRSLRGALRANWYRLRTRREVTLVSGGLLVFTHGSLLLVFVLATGVGITGLVLSFLVFPVVFAVLGLGFALALALVSPVVYAYTRALKIEAYRTGSRPSDTETAVPTGSFGGESHD